MTGHSIVKTELEIAKLKAETAKIEAETQRIKSKSIWLPVLVVSCVILFGIVVGMM